MKTSAIASLLFAATALAAPVELDRRDTYTTVKFEYVTVTETVWEDSAPTSVAGGAFFENPHKGQAGYGNDKPGKPTVIPTSAPPVAPSRSPAASAVAPSSTLVNTPPAQPTYQPAPEPTQPAPVPSTTTPPVVVAPAPTYAPAPSSVAPPPTTPSNPPSGGGDHAGSIFSINPVGDGALGACGKPLTNAGMWVAMGNAEWQAAGGSTYSDGVATNPWCHKMLEITCEKTGKTIQAEVLDLCPGCQSSTGLDLSHAAWAAIGMEEITIVGGTWKAL